MSGIPEAVAAFKAAPDAAQIRLGQAAQTTGFAILQRARANVRVRTGTLKAFLDMAFNAKTGVAKVGIRKGSVVTAGAGGSALTSKGASRETPSRIGHLVEFGTVYAAAHPFMIPAAEAERTPFLQRCHEAGKALEGDLTIGGGRT